MSVNEWITSLLSPSGVWSLVTMAVSVGGLVLAGHEPRWGWWWGIGAQVVWFIAGVATQRPGDVILSIIFTVLYVRNIRKNRGASYRNQTAALDEARMLREENALLRGRLDRCGVS